MSSILRVVCPPKQGLIFQPKQGSSFGFQDIHVSSVTWLSFPALTNSSYGSAKIPRLVQDPGHLRSRRTRTRALPLCFNGFQLGL